MSECKHEFETVNVSYLLSALKAITDRTKELTYEEKDAVITVCRHCERLKSDVERDELQAQVAVLRGALEEIKGKMCCETCKNLFLTQHSVCCILENKNINIHDWCEKWSPRCKKSIVANNALSTTPSEAAERVQKLVEVEQAAREYVESNSIKMSIWLGSSESLQMEKINKLEALRDALDALSEWRRDK